MRWFRSASKWILRAAGAWALSCGAFAQAPGPSWSPPDIANLGMPPHRHINRAQARARNAERQKQLVADTQRLLELANELQADAGQPDKDLSMDMIRKADEIQKLAKSVRDKMRDAS
ncbi:MAG TPA: hypothetical protein VN612_08065 [Acidobacteriaceae bacterium]|nr:hypothetical protein [Acidobacteriaceae bacterium]